jgi:hypothetical protein
MLNYLGSITRDAHFSMVKLVCMYSLLCTIQYCVSFKSQHNYLLLLLETDSQLLYCIYAVVNQQFSSRTMVIFNLKCFGINATKILELQLFCKA